MKDSNLYLILANIWIAISFLADKNSKFVMIIMGSIWLLSSFLTGKKERKKEKESNNPQKKIGGFGVHDKRFYIANGKLVDREERRVEGFEPVKNARNNR